jgi:uncharacterized protein with HEPN domain
MNTNKLPDYLGHMQSAAEDACGFMVGMSKTSFFDDRRSQNAVVMSLIVLGEAAARVMDLYPDFVILHPEIPWRKMRGMRNRITHGYFEVDFEMVWETVTTALPELMSQLTAVRRDSDFDKA